jgi:hypothetical protein
MFSFIKVIQYTQSTTNIEALKSYFDKSYEVLKHTNKKSNLISQFILILIIINFFPADFNKLKIFDVEFDIKIIKVLTPTLLSYFIFE